MTKPAGDTWAAEARLPIIDMHLHARKAQKRDIFYNNAARFLRLSKVEVARHHSL